jgi:hypothetical protein
MKRVAIVLVPLLSLTPIVVAAGCSSNSTPVAAQTVDAGYSTSAGQLHDPCTGDGFRMPTPNSIVCPGAMGCGCGGSQICCLQAVDSSKGTCTTLGACRALAITCDGPEDCNPQVTMTRDLEQDGGIEGDGSAPGADASTPPPPPPPPAAPRAVCCLDEAVGMSGGGSSCKAVATACTGRVLCRTDDDCQAVLGLPHCRPADYGTPGVEDRGLDGLIGVCSR